MQTELSTDFKETLAGAKAKDILRACVHCGFCAPVCPTYALTGNELDSPRGRIYQIKQMVEGNVISKHTQLHLDRCLTCGACEQACPSGVQYLSLLEIGRNIVEKNVPRAWREKLTRWLMRNIVSDASRFAFAATLGRMFKWALPYNLREKLPKKAKKIVWPTSQHLRKMIVLRGCVQPTVAPETNAAAARVLDRLGISLLEVADEGCCGAIHHHLASSDKAREQARRNIDAWWPPIEQGAEAIVMTASGCGLMVKEYGELLSDDSAYATKAIRVSALTKDLAEIVSKENLDGFARLGEGKQIAYQCPCTLQHGQRLGGVVEDVLQRCGYHLTTVVESQQCCGSAGTYSILQPTMASQLLEKKLGALMSGKPELIVSANIGCQMHLATRASVPIKHWIELLDQ